MHQTQAIYFDGVTSTAQQVEVTLHETISELHFQVAGEENITWHTSELKVEFYSNQVEIRPSGNLFALLKIDDADFISAFKSCLYRKGDIGFYQKMINWGFKVHLLIAVFILLLIAVGYFFVVPAIVEKSADYIPVSYDEQLGNTFMFSYLSENEIDTSKTKILNEFASYLQLDNTLELHFFVVESSTVNAFALPNGTIVIYTGLLNKITDYEELAGLIGHEVSHVNERHSMKMLCKNLAGYLFISALLSDVNGIMAIISENANQLSTLSYSRKYEEEADRQAVWLMIKNKIDPSGITNLFVHLKEEEKTKSIVSLPEFTLTHPYTAKRMENIKQMIRENEHEIEVNPVLEKTFDKLKASSAE